MEIQDYEGNNTTVVGTLEKKMKESNGNNFYESFMKICQEYKVGFYAIETEDEIEKYCVIITFNNYDSLEMKYSNKNLDISEKLAANLYRQVAIMIKNDEYLQGLKK